MANITYNKFLYNTSFTKFKKIATLNNQIIKYFLKLSSNINCMYP